MTSTNGTEPRMARFHWVRDPAGEARYVVAAGVGLAAYVLTTLASSTMRIEDPPDYGTILPNIVTFFGFLLVPASIFPSVVGSMFPRFWNATPVTLLNLAQLRVVLGLLAGGATYALTAFLFEPFLSAQQQWLVVPVLAAAMFLAIIVTVRLVGFSLAMLDPDRLSSYLHHVAAEARDEQVARQAFNDLCRLVRGLHQAERPTAAEHAIVFLGDIGANRPSLLTPDERGLAQRVLGKCRDAWPRVGASPGITRAREAVEAAWDALGLDAMNSPESAPG